MASNNDLKLPAPKPWKLRKIGNNINGIRKEVDGRIIIIKMLERGKIFWWKTRADFNWFLCIFCDDGEKICGKLLGLNNVLQPNGKYSQIDLIWMWAYNIRRTMHYPDCALHNFTEYFFTMSRSHYPHRNQFKKKWKVKSLTWWLRRCITSRNRVGRSSIFFVKICSKYPSSS